MRVSTYGLMTLDGDDFRHMYVDAVRTVLRHGRDRPSRLGPTKEIPDAVLVLDDPTRCFASGTGRKLSPAVAAVEALQLVAGVSRPDVLLRVAPQFREYAEDDGHFHGAYGRRVGLQLARIVMMLKQDPNTRQAVLQLWDSSIDLAVKKRDVPCTLTLTFCAYAGRLELHTTMRSNDAWLGLPYDVVQFTQLQLTVANILGLPAGPYFHHAVSLHLYERDWAAADELMHPDGSEVRRLAGVSGMTAVMAQARAAQLLDGLAPPDETETEAWLREALA